MLVPNRFDDRRIREEALRAFVKALHTDRMVAVTGAMTTRALGYPNWNQFISAYAMIAEELAEEILEKRKRYGTCDCPTDPTLERIKEQAGALLEAITNEVGDKATGRPIADKRVSMWVLHESFRAVDREMRDTRAGLVIANQYQASLLDEFEKRVAAIFRSRTLKSEPAGIRPLLASLGIKRVATLNYDLELERAFMVRRDEADLIHHDEERAIKKLDKISAAHDHYSTHAQVARFAAKHRLKNLPEMSSVQAFIGEPHTGKPIVMHSRHRLSRTMGNGIHVESDVVDRERPDRLFEFAIGSAETDRHILHLHGRVDAPETMVANIREYDRLYRLDDLYRDPFDHGLRMMMGGNPILFVGLGMEEPELLAPLQYLISNIPVRRPAPAFLIWNTDKDDADRDSFKREKRLDFLTRLGVHLLFDDDLRLTEDAAPIEAGGSHPAPTKPSDPYGILVDTLDRLPDLVKRVDRRIDRSPDKWRSIDERLGEDGDSRKTPYRMWGSEKLRTMVSVRLPGSDVPELAEKPRFDLDLLADPTLDGEPSADRLIFAAAPNGYGRGELSEYIAQSPRGAITIGRAAIKATAPENRLLVNAGFSYDSDAMLAGIARFLKRRCKVPHAEDGKAAARCRERYFADGSLFDTKDDTLIIINGVDRFFGFDGTPLSAEFDHMLRCANRPKGQAGHANGKVQFLLLGTQRVRHYCEALKLDLQQLPELARIHRDGPLDGEDATDTGIAGGIDLDSSYLSWVRTCFDKMATEIDAKPISANSPEAERQKRERRITPAAEAAMRRAASIDRDARYRTFYDAHLAPSLLKALGLNCPVTFEVLRTLCFIGTPVEATVLLHAPKVYSILAEHNVRNRKKKTHTDLGTNIHTARKVRRQLAKVIGQLCELGLLLKLDPHDPIIAPSAEPGQHGIGSGDDEALWHRYGLHRTLATFLRDRHGAPINDAKLATTFNMSLFMSEPSDTTTPEPGFHDELGKLVDSLIGGWHDIGTIYDRPDLAIDEKVPAESKKCYGEATDAEYILNLQDLYIHADDESRAIDSVGPRARREAAACLRAALSIVRGYYSTGALLKLDRGNRLASTDRDGALTEHAQRLDRLITGFGDIAVARKIARKTITEAGEIWTMGPEPFYADDLVWLHNERSVVALAQGQMFDAREALSAANRVNGAHVEEEYHGHNWRRIAVNMVSTRIERGSLKPAERLLELIETSITKAPWCERLDGRCGERIEAIRALFDEKGSVPPIRGTHGHSREEMFIVAMSTSYRGLIAHMRARFDEAKAHYETGIRMLRVLGEQRAYAHFQRQLASLEAFFGDKAAALRHVEFAIAAAQAARQMDILHRARIVRADLHRQSSQDETQRRLALQDIKDALSYAALADCYRLRIEASASLARHMRIGGDYDTALRYAADAITIAARYGHSLQKTSLRIELGRILDARGDPISGKALLDQAVAIGTSKGYNHALERVRRAKSAIPSISHRTDIPISG